MTCDACRVLAGYRQLTDAAIDLGLTIPQPMPGWIARQAMPRRGLGRRRRARWDQRWLAHEQFRQEMRGAA